MKIEVIGIGEIKIYLDGGGIYSVKTDVITETNLVIGKEENTESRLMKVTGRNSENNVKDLGDDYRYIKIQ